LSRTPAIQVPREFTTPAGARAATGAIDAIRIRLERLESSQDASGEALEVLRTELLGEIEGIEIPSPAAPGRARSILVPAEAMSVGDVIALSVSGAVRADTATLAHAGTVVGLVYEALSEGRVSVAADGDIVTSSAWSWDVGDIVYAGADGALQDEPGSDLWLRRIGVAADSQAVLVVMGEPVLASTDPDTLFLALDAGLLTTREAISQRVDAVQGIVATQANGVIHPTLTVGITNEVPAEGMYVPEKMTQLITELSVGGEHVIDGELYGL